MATVNNNQAQSFRYIESQFIEAFNLEFKRVTWLTQKYPDNTSYQDQLNRLDMFSKYYYAVQDEIERVNNETAGLLRQLHIEKNANKVLSKDFDEFMFSVNKHKQYIDFIIERHKGV
jgi:hypothetical protein